MNGFIDEMQQKLEALQLKIVESALAKAVHEERRSMHEAEKARCEAEVAQLVLTHTQKHVASLDLDLPDAKFGGQS